MLSGNVMKTVNIMGKKLKTSLHLVDLQFYSNSPFSYPIDSYFHRLIRNDVAMLRIETERDDGGRSLLDF